MQRAQPAHCEAPEPFHHQKHAPAPAGKGEVVDYQTKKKYITPKLDAGLEGVFLEKKFAS
jgi:hypothetical protein